MQSLIGDLLHHRMHPLDRIQHALRPPVAPIGRSLHADPPLGTDSYAVRAPGRPRDVPQHEFHLVRSVRLKHLLPIRRKAGVLPGQQPLASRVGQALRSLQIVQQMPPEELLESDAVEPLHRTEATVRSEQPFGHDEVEMRRPLHETSEGLDRGHHAWKAFDVRRRHGQGLAHRIVPRARQQPKQVPLPLEKTAQRFRDREHYVAMTNRRKNFFDKSLGKQRRSFRLA